MAKLLDQFGRPIDMSSLTEEVGTPSVMGVRNNWAPSVSNDLTPATLAGVLQAVDQNNDIQSYLTLAEEMEMRDLHYASVLSTRKNAVSGLEVMVEATSDDAEAVKQRDFVAEIVEQDAFDGLVRDQLDALGKSFSVNEIVWDRGNQWTPREYKWRDPHFFQFDIDTGEELRLRDESDLLNGLELEPYKWIQHRPRIKNGLPIRGGLARLACVAYMCKGYTLRDWMAFIEVFGMPLRLGKYEDGATDEQKSALLRAVSDIGMDAAAIINKSMDIDFHEASKTAGGENLFVGLANYLDSQVSKGVLGQTMTTDDGSSQSQAEVHQKVRDDIKKADAKQLSITLRRDLVRPLIDLNFAGEKHYPTLRVFVEDPEDLESLSKSLSVFIDRGMKVQASEVRDKFKLAEPEDGAELLVPKSGAVAAPVDVDEEADTTRALMRMVMKGETLTSDQRALLAMRTVALAQAGEPGDDIDRMTAEELSDWERIMDPVLQPVLAHARKAKGYQEFLGGLDGVLKDMDSAEFAERLATATFKMRGQGDASDEV